MTGRAFGILFQDLCNLWEVRSLRISLTNRCEWNTVRLGDISQIRSVVVSEQELQTGETQMLDRISFDEGKIFFGKRTETKMTQYRAKPNDIVISKINARKRAIGIVPEGNDISITIHFRALIPDISKIDTRYLWLALRNPFCTNQFDIETGGMGKGEISEERLLNICVPFPPLDMQRKIVAAWHQAQAKVVRAQERVMGIEREIESRFFADLGLETSKGSSRLKFFALQWKDIERWGVESNSSKQKITTLNGIYPTVRLRDIVKDLQNGWSPKCLDRPAQTDEWGVLKLGAVSFGSFDSSANKALPKELKARLDYEVKKGDVLISRGNVLSLVGAAVYVNSDTQKLMIPDLIFRVVWKADSLIHGDYLAKILQTTILRKQIEAVATGTSPTMKKVTKPALLNLKLPLPPLNKQEEIMYHVEAGREQILKEKFIAMKIVEESEIEVEKMILGLIKI